jgi:hypothetical protein
MQLFEDGLDRLIEAGLARDCDPVEMAELLDNYVDRLHNKGEREALKQPALS